MSARTLLAVAVAFVCFDSSLSSGPDRIALKTVAEKPMAFLDEFTVTDSGHLLAGKTLVPFSSDGRQVLPHLGVAAYNPTAGVVTSGGRTASFVTPILTLMVQMKGGQQLLAANSDAASHFYHSPDREHWVIALRNKNNTKACSIIADSKEIRSFESSYDPPAGDFTFSVDGKRLAYWVKERGKAFVVSDEMAGPEFGDIEDGSIRFSPDSRHLAYQGLRGNERILVCDGREIRTSKAGSGATAPSETIWFGSDSRMLVLHVAKVKQMVGIIRELKIYDTQSGAWLFEDAVVNGYGRSPDGQSHYVIKSLPDNAHRIALNDGSEKTYAEIGEIRVGSGGRLAMTAKKLGKWVVVVDGAEGKGFMEIDNLHFSPDGRRLAYAAKDLNKKWFMVVDGSEQGPFEEVAKRLKPYQLGAYPRFFFTNTPGKSSRERWIAFKARNSGMSGNQFDTSDSVAFPEVGLPLAFSPDSQRIAYTARSGKQWDLVVDGKTVCSHSEMGLPVFSPDSRRVAVWASANKQDFAVLDGKALPAFDEVDKWHFVFSPDSRHLAYQARKGKQWFVVVDDTPSTRAFDRLITNHEDSVPIVFKTPDSLYYVGMRKKEILLIDEKIESAPGGQ